MSGGRNWTRAGCAFCALVWACATAGGLVALSVYGNTPGTASTPPKTWPEQSALMRGHDRATLLVFLHPQCPCSRATLDELARLVRAVHGLVLVQVVMVDAGAQWETSALARAAAQIPTVRVYADCDAREARRFAAHTSGAALLYDCDGKLLFHGGLTKARGHAGDNAGADSVQALLRGAPAVPSTPVFGCPLLDHESCPEPALTAEGHACCQQKR